MAKQELTIELHYGGTWHEVPAYVRSPASITRERPAGSEPTPATVRLTLQGIWNPKSAFSPLYGTAGQNTPIRATLSSDTRFYGEVASWEPERTEDYNATTGRGDAWTAVTAAGILRRLGQGTDPFRSPMFRAMSGTTEDDYEALDYWPGEDGTDATSIAAWTPGTNPASVSGDVEFGGYTGSAGSDPVPVLRTGALVSGRFSNTTLAVNGSGDTGWNVEFMGMIPSTLSADANFLDIDVPPTGGDAVTMLRVVWQHSSSRLQLRWYNASLVVVGFVELDLTGLRDIPALFAINLSTDVVGAPGAIGVNFSMWTAASVGFPAAFDFDSWTASAVPVPTTWRAYASAGNTGWSFSHYAFYTDPAAIMGSTVQDNARALSGYSGETARARIIRLCREEGIPLTVEGTDSQLMGPQPTETLLALFAEVERTDDGMVFEPRDGYGLVYRCGRERYNRTPALELDWSTHDVAPPLRPVLDDLSSRNDVTVKRRNGSEARAVLLTGALSVQAPPNGIGRYTTKVDVNTSTDDVLPDHAWWHLSKGTIDGVRYASVTVDLDAKPGLVADAAAVDIGDIITIANLPADEHPGLAKLYVLGYTETIGSHRRVITYSCAPGEMFDIGVWGTDAQGSRWGARNTVLAEDLTTVETAADVTATGEVWITTASHPSRFPFNVDIGGLTYSCTGITGSTPNYTLTIVRVADDKTHGTGASVTVTDTDRYGL